jgi:hypothetical protein
MKQKRIGVKTHNKHIKNRPQKTRAGLAAARLLFGRYEYAAFCLLFFVKRFVLTSKLCASFIRVSLVKVYQRSPIVFAFEETFVANTSVRKGLFSSSN